MAETTDQNDVNEDITRSLREVVDDIEVFVASFVERLLEVAKSDRSATNSPQQIQTDSSKFDQERAAWEEQRRVQELEIRKRFDQLTDAWLRLEDEQREFLELKEQYAVHRSGTSIGNSRVVPETDTATIGSERIRESSVLQFQRLKQEIHLRRSTTLKR